MQHLDFGSRASFHLGRCSSELLPSEQAHMRWRQKLPLHQSTEALQLFLFATPRALLPFWKGAVGILRQPA